MTENPPTPDDDETGSAETTILSRRDLDEHTHRLDLGKDRAAGGASAVGEPDGGVPTRPVVSESVVSEPVMSEPVVSEPLAPQHRMFRHREPEQVPETEQTVAVDRSEPAVVDSDPVPAPVPTPPRRSRRLDAGEEAVVLPPHRPWTMVVAGLLAVLWGLEAAFELVFNWSRLRGIPNPPGRYSVADITVAHSSGALANYISAIAVSTHFDPHHNLDTRIALGAFAVVWLIIGLLLLLARGSGIRLGLLFCGLVALPAFGLARGGIDTHGWGLKHWTSTVLTLAYAAPFILDVLIALLTGTRRARLFSGRPAEPEFVDVNDPGEVWRGR